MADSRADKVIGKVSDDVWSAVGRPTSDIAIDLLFPGGNAFYKAGEFPLVVVARLSAESKAENKGRESVSRLIRSTCADSTFGTPRVNKRTRAPRVSKGTFS